MQKYNEAMAKGFANRAWYRAKWHDYYSKCIYMITINKMPGIPDFGFVKGAFEKGKAIASFQPLQLGHHIGRALRHLQRNFDFVIVRQYAIMPDHIHIILEVTKATDIHLETIIRFFMKDCSGRYKDLLLKEEKYYFEGDVYEPGYNDSILRYKNQLDGFYKYLQDNPRRLYLRQVHPKYFNTSLLCLAGNETFSVYGNLLLLEHPSKAFVKFSRKDTLKDLELKKSLWNETLRSGGVLVSAFIHPIEKEFLKLALKSNGKCIIVKENGFHNRWKPTKAYIDACAEGRLLFIGPEEYRMKKIMMAKTLADKMNKQADMISKLRPGDFALRKLRR